jgi:hypothetical protein
MWEQRSRKEVAESLSTLHPTPHAQSPFQKEYAEIFLSLIYFPHFPSKKRVNLLTQLHPVCLKSTPLFILSVIS